MKVSKLSLCFSLFLIVMPVGSAYGFDEYEVEVNGELLDHGFVRAFSEFYIDPAFDCYGRIDQWVLSAAIARKLVLDKGRALELETTGEADYEVLEAFDSILSDDRDEKRAAQRTLFAEKGASYMFDQLPDGVRKTARALHKTMLQDKHPLLIDANYVKTAGLTFDSRDQAESMIKKLSDEMSFDLLAEEMGQASERYAETKTQWWHEAVFPKHGRSHDGTIQTGDVIGPFYANLSWQVRLVLDVETRPVTQFDDIVSGDSMDMGTAMAFALHDKQYYALVNQLWDSSSVKINGESVPKRLEVDCSESALVRQISGSG